MSDTQNRLASCPFCSSKLIYPIDVAGWSRDTVLSRRCPECEHRDVVVTGRLPALLWLERNARQRDELAALCDAIADGLLLGVDLALPPQAGQDETTATGPGLPPPLPGSVSRSSPRGRSR